MVLQTKLKKPRSPSIRPRGWSEENQFTLLGPHTKIHIIFDPGQKVGLLGHGRFREENLGVFP